MKNVVGVKKRPKMLGSSEGLMRTSITHIKVFCLSTVFYEQNPLIAVTGAAR